MNEAERIVRKLDECIKIMKRGLFTKYDLEFISVGLKKMLEKTEEILKKTPTKEDQKE
jgi:hypothetical protein